jgi:hypothetical protein
MHVEVETAPKAAENFPATQLTQLNKSAAPTVPEYFPVGHGTHVLEEPAPLVAEYVPATQRVQAYTPKLENFPATHWLQAGPVPDTAV